MRSLTLNTGVQIPQIGLGTWQAEPGQVEGAVAFALQSGYRHIDCAMCYGNEAEVGKGIRGSGVEREAIFLVSKLWCTYHDRVEECLDLTLNSLATDYLDLYLVHWPARTVPNGTSPLFPTTPDGSRNVDWDWDQVETWRQMEALLKTGKVRAIGVSNYSIMLLENLKRTWKVVPAVNQVELHPYNPQHDLMSFCSSNGILMEAYSPLGSTNSPLHREPAIGVLAERHLVSSSTILLSWLVNKGIVVLPKSVTPGRIVSNLNIISLDPSEIESLDVLAAQGKQHRFNSPAWKTDFGFVDWYGLGNKDAPNDARLLAGRRIVKQP